MEIKLMPVAIVKNSRLVPTVDFWEGIISEIELAESGKPNVSHQRRQI